MRHLSILTLGLLAVASSARADLVLQFGQSNYDVAAGGLVKVDVYLTETGTDLLAANGLIGAGLLVNFNESPFAADPAQVTDVSPNPGVNPGPPDFDFLITSISPAGAGVAGVAELDWGLTVNTFFPPAGESSLLIGTFTFAAGSIVGDVTHLSTGLSGLKFVLGDGTDIDDTFGISPSSATITAIPSVIGVPEPASLGLMIAGLAGVSTRLLRSRTRRTATSSDE